MRTLLISILCGVLGGTAVQVVSGRAFFWGSLNFFCLVWACYFLDRLIVAYERIKNDK